MSQVDELFGGGGAPEPRTWLITALLFAGTLTSLAGLGCSVIPGVLITGGAWYLVERDLGRVEAGFYPEASRPRLQSLEHWTVAALVFALVLMFVQGFLHCIGVYLVGWGTVIQWVLDALPEKPVGT
jgi:hypothetical protein